MIVPEFVFRPEPVDAAAQSLGRDLLCDAEVGTRHRLGGRPSGQGIPDFPRCLGCDQVMTFYGQLDSLPHIEYELADAGLILVFVCFGCFEVAATLQTT